jgi:hypothetical protein
LASDGEQGEIEVEFAASWDGAERFFAEIMTHTPLEYMDSMLELIAELRKRGYDRKFRAGTQMLEFLLSRSRQYGLQAGQAVLRIELHPKGGMKVRYFQRPDADINLKLQKVEITPAVADLLKRLLAQPID